MNLAGSSGVEEETRSACDVEVGDNRLDHTWLMSRGKRVLMASFAPEYSSCFLSIFLRVCMDRFSFVNGLGSFGDALISVILHLTIYPSRAVKR